MLRAAACIPRSLAAGHTAPPPRTLHANCSPVSLWVTSFTTEKPAIEKKASPAVCHRLMLGKAPPLSSQAASLPAQLSGSLCAQAKPHSLQEPKTANPPALRTSRPQRLPHLVHIPHFLVAYELAGVAAAAAAVAGVGRSAGGGCATAVEQAQSSRAADQACTLQRARRAGPTGGYMRQQSRAAARALRAQPPRQRSPTHLDTAGCVPAAAALAGLAWAAGFGGFGSPAPLSQTLPILGRQLCSRGSGSLHTGAAQLALAAPLHLGPAPPSQNQAGRLLHSAGAAWSRANLWAAPRSAVL